MGLEEITDVEILLINLIRNPWSKLPAMQDFRDVETALLGLGCFCQ